MTSGTSGTSASPIEHPTDPDAAIVRIGAPGSLPSLVIGGDGWAYQPTAAAAEGWTSTEAHRRAARPLHAFGSAQPAMAPAPPAPTPVERRRLTPAGVQIVLALADDLGLLAVPDEYEDPGVTDMGSTFVMLAAGDGTFEHVAYALGFDDETGNRANLEQFVEAVADLEGLVGAGNIGPSESYVPDVHVVSRNGGYLTEGFEITWPADVPVEEGCIALPVDRFPDGVAGLFIADVDGEPTRVAVIPDLPGDEC